MARDVQHLERAERVSLLECLVDRARRVGAEPQRQPDLEGDIRLERAAGQDRHRLRLAVARDDVGLPFVGQDGGAALALQDGEPAQVRAVTVRERDALEVRRRAAEPLDLGEHQAPVGLVEGVDEEEVGTVLDQEGTHPAALLAADRMDAGRQFHATSLSG